MSFPWNRKAGPLLSIPCSLVAGLTDGFLGEKRKTYLEQLETIAKEARNGHTPLSLHSDESPGHPFQRNDPSVRSYPAFHDDMSTQDNLLELPSHSYHPTNHGAGIELDLPSCLPGCPPLDPIPGESVDGLQSGVNFFDENSTIPPPVPPTSATFSDNIFSLRMSNGGQDISGIAEAELRSSHGENQRMMARNVDQFRSSPNRLGSLLGIEDSVSQRYSLGDIVIAGIRTLSEREKQPMNDTSANSSTTDPGNDPRQTLAPITHLERCEIPDIHMNTIQLTTISFVAACVANASMLGLSLETLWDKTTQSPFYQAQVANEPCGAANAGQFAHLKPLLRPSTTQLTHPHHPYLDILPFPAFRNRIIQLLQIQPPPFDPDQLCRDLRSDGLICWGSTKGDRRDAVGSGAPWDMRSWEINPWFLRKWWILFDGPHGEMYQHSRWWCELRGEKSLYPW